MSNKGMGLGASIVSNNILENKANIKWILRENSVNELLIYEGEEKYFLDSNSGQKLFY